MSVLEGAPLVCGSVALWLPGLCHIRVRATTAQINNTTIPVTLVFYIPLRDITFIKTHTFHFEVGVFLITNVFVIFPIVCVCFTDPLRADRILD